MKEMTTIAMSDIVRQPLEWLSWYLERMIFVGPFFREHPRTVPLVAVILVLLIVWKVVSSFISATGPMRRRWTNRYDLMPHPWGSDSMVFFTDMWIMRSLCGDDYDSDLRYYLRLWGPIVIWMGFGALVIGVTYAPLVKDQPWQWELLRQPACLPGTIIIALGVSLFWPIVFGTFLSSLLESTLKRITWDPGDRIVWPFVLHAPVYVVVIGLLLFGNVAEHVSQTERVPQALAMLKYISLVLMLCISVVHVFITLYCGWLTLENYGFTSDLLLCKVEAISLFLAIVLLTVFAFVEIQYTWAILWASLASLCAVIFED